VFQLDAAATLDNSKCASCITPEEDALDPATQWIYSRDCRLWLHPGFSNVGPWMERAYVESQEYIDAVVVVMSLISPSTKWWRDWAMKASEIRLLGGKRVQFVAPPGVKQSSNTRENCLIIFRPNPHNREPYIWTWAWPEGKE